MVTKKRRCECPSLRFMMFMNSASTQDEGTGWYGKGKMAFVE